VEYEKNLEPKLQGDDFAHTSIWDGIQESSYEQKEFPQVERHDRNRTGDRQEYRVVSFPIILKHRFSWEICSLCLVLSCIVWYNM
jgi:hypothetical protein